jgi:hypothetical protein
VPIKEIGVAIRVLLISLVSTSSEIDTFSFNACYLPVSYSEKFRVNFNIVCMKGVLQIG